MGVDCIQAIDAHIRSDRQPSFKRIDPSLHFPFVLFHLFTGLGDTMRVIRPSVRSAHQEEQPEQIMKCMGGMCEEIVQWFGHRLISESTVILTHIVGLELEHRAIAVRLIFLVIGGLSTLGQNHTKRRTQVRLPQMASPPTNLEWGDGNNDLWATYWRVPERIAGSPLSPS